MNKTDDPRTPEERELVRATYRNNGSVWADRVDPESGMYRLSYTLAGVTGHSGLVADRRMAAVEAVRDWWKKAWGG